MAAGDTLTGQVRVVKGAADGSEIVVAGPFSSIETDQRGSLKDAIYINTWLPKVSKPFGAANLKDSDAIFLDGEIMRVQHKSASLAEAIDYDADEFMIGVIEFNLTLPKNHEAYMRGFTLTVADTELTANPTSSTSAYVTIFQDTTPGQRARSLGGVFIASAVENA